MTSWSQVWAQVLATVGGAVLAAFVIYRQLRSLRLTRALDVLLRLDGVFEDQMRDKRRRAAEEMRRRDARNRHWDFNSEATADLEDIFKFFETVGSFARRHAATYELVAYELLDVAQGYWSAGVKTGFIDAQGNQLSGNKEWPQFRNLMVHFTHLAYPSGWPGRGWRRFTDWIKQRFGCDRPVASLSSPRLERFYRHETTRGYPKHVKISWLSLRRRPN